MLVTGAAIDADGTRPRSRGRAAPVALATAASPRWPAGADGAARGGMAPAA
ncbi:MAG TPA: hypothetical protein VF162_15095 [Streptosporangiaceae bacterium]